MNLLRRGLFALRRSRHGLPIGSEIGRIEYGDDHLVTRNRRLVGQAAGDQCLTHAQAGFPPGSRGPTCRDRAREHESPIRGIPGDDPLRVNSGDQCSPRDEAEVLHPAASAVQVMASIATRGALFLAERGIIPLSWPREGSFPEHCH
jgi:hypothetical protein